MSDQSDPTNTFLDTLLAHAEPYHPPDLPDISLIKLIANPTSYQKQLVRVHGFLNLEFEGTALYLHREDCQQMLTHNALWLNITGEIWKRRYDLTERYVTVTGIFREDCRGHMDGYSGAITRIQDLRAMPSREEIEAFLKGRNKE